MLPSHFSIRALQCAFFGVITSGSMSALAQEQTAAGAEGAATGPTEEVIVTGTRIISPNMTSTSPIQVISSREIEQQGRADISDVLYQLPQNFNNSLGQGFSSRTSGLSTAGGLTTADLRGLGPQRTLVLVNGRRLGPGSPHTSIQAPAPNLDQIPMQLVERVDVVTGGASAVYGSDAIAGVINFVMKRNFEGVQVDSQYGENWHNNHNDTIHGLLRDFGEEPDTGSVSDGENYNATLTVGKNFWDGRGNITAYAGYLRRHPVSSADRDFGACQIFINADLTGPECGGSANANYFRPRSGPAAYTVVGNEFVEWPGPGTQSPPPVYNSQQYIYVSRDDARRTAGLTGHLEINEYVEPYTEFSYMKDDTHQITAPSGLFRDQNVLNPTGGGAYLVNCDNPFLSDQQRTVMSCSGNEIVPIRIGRRNVEGGNRQNNFEHEAYRYVLGARGEFGGAFSYDAYGQYYRTTLSTFNGRYLNLQNVANALLVTGTRDNPACISGAPCVPWNIFEEGGVTQEALDYLQTPGTSDGKITEKIWHTDVTADLGEYGLRSPLATEGLGVNVGYERRSQTLVYEPDEVLASGLLAGTGGAQVPIDASSVVNEEFVELRAPLLQDRPGVQYLALDFGFRHSDYDIVGGVNTRKFEVQYSPIRDVRVRGSYQRAIRAPSLIELFTQPNVGQITFGEDPCAGANPTASIEECRRTGVTDAQYNSGTIPQGTASQLSQLQSGNEDLDPETATSYTLGVTFNPSFLPDFSGSIDWYRIKVEDEVDVLPASFIVQNCMASGDPVYCNEIVRSPANGGLTGASVASGGYIKQTLFNLGSKTVSGVDAQAAYRVPIAQYGSLVFSLAGTYLDKVESTPVPGQGSYDCAGLFGFTCQTVNPRWRHNARVSWNTPWHGDVSLLWRFLSKVKLDNNDSNPLLFGSSFGEESHYNTHIGSYSYFDFSTSWTVIEQLRIRAGVNNILDKDPPFVTSEIVAGGAANTYETYDTLGREVYIGFTATFGGQDRGR